MPVPVSSILEPYPTFSYDLEDDDIDVDEDVGVDPSDNIQL